MTPTKLPWVVLTLSCAFTFCYGQSNPNRDVKQQPELSKISRNWADKLGGELWHFGELVTRRKMVIDSYQRTTIQWEDGEALLNDIAQKIKDMMDKKVEAIKRIKDVAENKAVMQKDDVEPSFEFYNAKKLNNSEEDENMPSPQPLRYYAPYVSQNEGHGPNGETLHNMVQPEEPEEPEAYQRDQDLDDSGDDTTQEEDTPRINNNIEVTDGSEQDPLASQRPPDDKRRLPLYRNPRFYNIPVNTNYSVVHVPSNVYERSKEVIKGIKWSEELDGTFRSNYRNDPLSSWQYFGSSTGFMRQFPAMIWSQEPIDLFDCRTRSWYIEAASSPKDVVILVDRSGSMTGMRREIARHVVNNILDTLGNNDYVNIFTFSNTTDPLIECFEDILVQANLANIRMLKEGMSSFKTEQIANFSLALTTAFRLLQDYRENRSGQGAQCNQAIMLITDGVQYNYIEVFKEYNWQNLPFMPVRVFTYLIGREVSDVRDVKWMACANQGYYVHLSTYAEVREQVLQYVPVMARPMVLNPTLIPNPTWSPVYADVTDPKLTNWLWVTRERNKQRDRFLLYRRNKTLSLTDDQDKKFVYQQKFKQDNFGEMQSYRLMTSVSLPVYDKRPNANITEKIQINEAVWIEVTRETRVANLLGVAGTDVPIEYIQRQMLPYRLGVNGYAFIVTNNGYILTHPDLRPVFQGILKPSYNRVDLTEIEVMDDDTEPRDFNESILEFRKNVVMQNKGKITLNVKEHIDYMRRLILHNRSYYYKGIENTPFSLVVTLPDRYGVYRILHPIDEDIHRLRSKNQLLTHFFQGNWSIHPDWHYCRYGNNNSTFESPEKELYHFLQKIDQPGWKWGGECDRKLLCKLAYDAKITEWFSQNISSTNKEENGNEFIKRFGITVAFLATHSGLTRWQDFPQNIGERENNDEPHFHQLHNKAIDEVWYKRAVLQHYLQPRSFIYSVPFYVGAENYTLVTASHAIFREDSKDKEKKAPAAVVGFQFYHTALHSLFEKITGNCGDIKNCRRTCTSEELLCVVLDDNGYVIVSDDRQHTGFFFGDIRKDVMQQLVDEGIYKTTVMYDYQATCFQAQETANPGSTFSYPLNTLKTLFEWLLHVLAVLVHSVNSIDIDVVYDAFDGHREEIYQSMDCDEEFWVYTYTNNTNTSTSNTQTFTQTREYKCKGLQAVEPIPYTNLLLLVINKNCPVEQAPTFKNIHRHEVTYGTERECVAARTNLERNHYYTCFNEEYVNPLSHLRDLVQWAAGTMIYLLKSTWADNMDTELYHDQQEQDEAPADVPPMKTNDKELDSKLLIKKTQPEPCDHRMWLYNLVHYTDRNISRSGYNKTMSDNCSRPFIVQPIVGSNMILLVINNICPEEKEVEEYLSPNPEEVKDYNMSLGCYRARQVFPRRHYMSCINRSIHEQEIKLCGKGLRLEVTSLLIILSVLFILNL